jgi:CHAD domain-containing protein
MNPMADVERARRWLTRSPPSSRAVHEARRRLRRARAVLKLGRGTAVERECARAGAACRRAARALAPLRDARVFAETLEDLLSRGGADLPAGPRA